MSGPQQLGCAASVTFVVSVAGGAVVIFREGLSLIARNVVGKAATIGREIRGLQRLGKES
jgi:hypothetical protein